MENIGRLTGHAHPAFDFKDIADWYMRQTGNDIEGAFQLRSSLQEALDGFASMNLKELQPGSGILTVLINQPTKDLSFRLTELSEGQRCLIALYMSLHFLIARGKTVFLDEPDNFVSLREIQPWLLAAEQVVEDHNGQLILISHHPEILNYWAREYGLLFSREENGHVRTKAYREVSDTGLDPAETIARGWEG
jgi:predicted ATPase